MDPVVVLALVAAIVVVFLVASSVRIVPQARRYNVERFGRYRRTLQPGLNLVVPVADRINTKLDVREQVYSSDPRPVITEDNLVVNIDTVLYYQITDPRAAAYEVADYLHAIDQLTVTTLRNVIGSMDLEETLTSREEINSRLRAVLDDATGKWGIRVNRVEIKAIDPPHTIKEAMEKQMRAERDKRAAILHAEGERQAKILTAEGTKQKDILEAQGTQQAMILRADGEAKAVELVFQAVHRNNADPKILAYKYLETLPHLASSDNNTFWVIPGELTEAVRTVTRAFGDQPTAGQHTTAQPDEAAAAGTEDLSDDGRTPELGAGWTASLGAAAAADEAGKQAAAAVSDAKAEAEAAKSPQTPRRGQTSDD
ncbi:MULTISPECIES: SPFH domain-containing protein [Streptomyces]|uniref:SPFH/Band 7/PHB domain protein n=1 Tax=Streptomyces koelreuteriae TaxID=2838015 RepID=A0ABX8FNI7_9ACTN|nr:MULTISPECIES: SPFH domain-containing protein [Streptomyces]QWB22584.1 SPFH/Band 7/PHB domain protein [Streptomyces koelreuteriae]UUA05533.1 SPFH/Band 7/PHB domain protein [Streptomyces koelreuteriae]UUA13160.1 SPFH/Band 7/PHB domain protein [Streptomyces sp. CRCS-T-1]